MKQKREKKTRSHTLLADGDLHCAIGLDSPDPKAWAESVRGIATQDRDWLRDHPEAPYRRRLITPIEMKASGYKLPPDTQVLVRRGPDGSQIRCFCAPSDKESTVPLNIVGGHG